MKKLIAIAVVLALVAGVAFAQTANGIQVQAWGRGAFSPITAYGAPQVNGETGKDVNGDDLEGESYAGSSTTWGSNQFWPNEGGTGKDGAPGKGGKIRVDFRINGVSEFVGFNTQFSAENAIGIEDNLHIWAKPFGSDILKVSVGKIADDTLRGKIGNLDGGFCSFVLAKVDEEDAIFTRLTTWDKVNSNSPYGFAISSAPIEGLFIGLAVSGELDGGNYTSGDNYFTPAAKAYQFMQIGAGYNIANIGHIRLQYIGGWSGTKDATNADDMKYWNGNTSDLARIEAAFAVTAVEGLLVDIGGKFWLPLEVKDSKTYSKGVDFSLGATYNTGALGIGARLDITGLGAYADGRLKDDDKHESGASTVIRLVPTYAIGDATIGLDVAFAIAGKSKLANGDVDEDSGGSQIGFGAFVSKGLGNGNIKAGLSYTLPPNTGKDNKANGQGIFQIPIILEYAFF